MGSWAVDLSVVFEFVLASDTSELQGAVGGPAKSLMVLET